MTNPLSHEALDAEEKAERERWHGYGAEIYRMVQVGEPWEELDDEKITIATFHEPDAEANCSKVMLATEYHDQLLAALMAFIAAHQPGVSPELDKAHQQAVFAISDMQNGGKY